MADPLALYTAVMGKLWEEGRIQGQRHARIEARIAGRRQGRSYQRTGRLSARNMLKAALPESRAAVFKRIRAGGCKTRSSLGNQLAYVNDKAVYSYSTMTNVLTDGAVLSEDQKTEVIEAWSETWRGTTKLGFTSHMLLSFPKDVSVDQVKEITLDWAEHFFESGNYGDQWDYVLSVHDDRAHKHAHIILNNRGIENGTWFSCWAEGVMSPQLMREKQAEIAETYGVVLEATTRLERGIFAKAPGIDEIYRAKEEARLPRDIAMTPQERDIAKAQVVGFAKDYADLADMLDHMDQAHLARAMRGMAKALGTGTPYKFNAGDIDMETIRADIKTVGDAIDYAEKTIEALRLKAEELDVTDRPAFEAKAAPVIRDLSKMVPDPDLRARFARDLVDPYPPGAGDETVIAALASGQEEALEGLKAYAEKIGLDGDEITARIETGGTTNYGLAQDWVERDMTAVLAKDGIDLSRASDAQQEEALEKVDTFMDGLRERAEELGVAIGLGREADAEQSFVDESDRGPNPYLQELADMLRDGDLSEAQEVTVERTLKAELMRELGETGLAELRRGNYEVLCEALPNRIDQITVTQEFLELTHEETGDTVFTERASALQQDKVNEVTKQTNLEMQRGSGSERQLEFRDLDDDMGL
ncbi:relaxase/mobilization nuclease domain-containing protein [uncultured Roseovarius sp.]|uniref:relaxase/mobilization nuclease domain-containing protein n=1 Tax=uncultured Roseovarius sp. TaxID=293344 RepID=UPI0026036F8D|nr:relaxase/mobilization nuclease domain-containing protein [uncultured Roseovarius sp.]